MIPLSYSKIQSLEYSPCVSNKKEDRIRAKWLDLQLDSQWLNAYVRDVRFLVKTRLIYSILGFQNSTANGFKENEIKVDSLNRKGKKGLWIKKEGQWVSISKINQLLQWDSKEHVLVSKNNPYEKWSYFSNDGLLPIYTAYEPHLASNPQYPQANKNLRHVAKLSKQEMAVLLDHAKCFCDESKDVAKSSAPITCAIQFFSHPNLKFKKNYLQNLNTQLRVHCGIRLIVSDGSIYSFGFGANAKEHVIKGDKFRSVATVNGQPKILDYTEFYKYKDCVVTTVPLTEAQTKNILDCLNLYRAEGVRFNVLKQNCVRAATHLLYLSGISLNTRVSFFSVFWRSLPRTEQIPIVGKPLYLTKRISQKMIQFVDYLIPSIVKKKFEYLAAIVFYIPNQLGILILNLGLIILGGRIASSNTCLSLERSSDSRKLENFDRLVSDLFDSEASYVHHSAVFINWQLNQKTTEVYQYSGQPKMNILPHLLDIDKATSRERKNELKAIYQDSV